ncbi:MAG: dihydrodipicolinate synthase family protein [Thermoplasmata archaeon]
MNDIIVPIITPFDRENKIDKAKLKRHADYLIKNGINYLLLCGSTGLGPSLKKDEKIEILETLNYMNDKLILQVGSLDVNESKELAEIARKNEIKYIASLPPYYYPRFPEEWYVRYFKEISEIYPTLVYNFPLTTNYDIKPELVKKVNKSGGNIVGIKDTTPDLDHILNFKWEFGKDFKVYSGPDSLILPSIRMGIDGAVPGSGNYVSKLIRNMIDNKNENIAVEEQKTIDFLISVSRKFGQWSANYSLVKLINGYDVGFPRPPVYPLNDEKEAELFDTIKNVINK